VCIVWLVPQSKRPCRVVQSLRQSCFACWVTFQSLRWCLRSRCQSVAEWQPPAQVLSAEETHDQQVWRLLQLRLELEERTFRYWHRVCSWLLLLSSVVWYFPWQGSCRWLTGVSRLATSSSRHVCSVFAEWIPLLVTNQRQHHLHTTSYPRIRFVNNAFYNARARFGQGEACGISSYLSLKYGCVTCFFN